jgi:hypothetical protein
MGTIELFYGFITILIAGFATYIAYQQFLLKKQILDFEAQKILFESHRIKFELYEKRLRIFRVTKKILHKIVQDGKIDLCELRDFMFDTDEKAFLFENDINEFITSIKKYGIDLNHSNDKIKNQNQFPLGSQQLIDQIEEDSKPFKWFSYEYENVENKFLKYLDFKNL